MRLSKINREPTTTFIKCCYQMLLSPYYHCSQSSLDAHVIESRKNESTKARKGSDDVEYCFDVSNFRAFVINIFGLQLILDITGSFLHVTKNIAAFLRR